MPRPTASATDPFGSTGSAVGEMTYDELFARIAQIRSILGPARVAVFVDAVHELSRPYHAIP